MIDKDSVLKIIEPRLNSSKKGSLEYQRLFSIMHEIQALPIVTADRETTLFYNENSHEDEYDGYDENGFSDYWEEN